MRCRRADKLITGHLCGELSATDAEALERHLAGCERCRTEYEAGRAALRHVQAAMPPPPQAVAHRVMAAVRATASAGAATLAEATHVVAPPRSRWAWRPRPAIAAAVVGILVIAATALWLLRPQRPSVQPPVGTTPQVAQDRPDVAPPQPAPSDRAEDSEEAPRPAGAAPDGEPSAPEDQTPHRDGSTPEQAVPDRPPRDDSRPRSTPRDDRLWRPGRIAEETGRAETHGRLRERPVDVRQVASYGRVTSVTGVATIRREGREGPRLALVADALGAGDVLKTDADSSLVAEFGDGSSLELAAGTELSIGERADAADRPSRAELVLGDIVATIKPGGGPFEVDTPLAVAGVQGTKFGLEATDRKAVLTVFEGEVAFSNDLGSVVAAAMERSVVVPGHRPTDPHRLAGRMPGGIYAGKWHLHHGEYLYVDTIAHTTPEVQAILEELQTAPEKPELLEAAMGALWSRRGGISLSLECAREVVGRRARLSDLRRADLGTVHPLTVEAGTVGVPVFEVLHQSPADQAGLRRGDAIIAINGAKVDGELQLADRLWRTGPGTEVDVSFVRDGEEQTVTIATSSALPGPQELALFAALRLINADPDHFGAQIVIANALACTGQLEEARAAYEALPSNHLADAVVHNNLGVLAAIDGRLGDALQGYGTAAELCPEFEGAWLNIAKVYGRSGMDAAELAMLERLVGEHPTWEGMSAALAWHYGAHDRGAEKLTTIQDLAEAHPESPELAAYLVRALDDAGQNEQAAAACERALSMEASFQSVDALAVYLLSGAEGRSGFDELLRAWALHREPWAYVRFGTDAALAQGLELDPLNATGYTGYIWQFVGDRHMKAERYPEAEECFSKAAELEEEWALPWQCAADAAEAVGEDNRAAKHREEAVRVGVVCGEAHPENLEVALRNAVTLATRAALAGDRELRDHFTLQGEQAAEKAEALANETAPELWLVLARDYYLECEEWENMERALERMAELDPARAARAVMDATAIVTSRGHFAAQASLLLIAMGLEPAYLSVKEWGYLAEYWDSLGEHCELCERFLAALRGRTGRLEDEGYLRSAIALLLVFLGDAEGALQELDAIEQGQTSAYWYALYARARALEAAGETQDALAAGLEGLRVWPAGARPHILMGCLKRLDRDATTEALEARIAAEGPHIYWLYMLADLQKDAGDLEGEEETRKLIARRHPQWGEMYLANFYRDHGRMEEAEAVYRRSLAVFGPGHKMHAKAQGQLAAALAANRKWDEALDHASLALQVLPGAAEASDAIRWACVALEPVLKQAITLEQETRAREAVLICLRAVDAGEVAELGSWSEDPLLDAVRAAGAKGDPAQQAEFWLQVLRLDGNTPTTENAMRMAMRQFAAGEPERAREHFEALVTEDPTDPEAHIGLWRATKGRDAETAVEAALAAVAGAGSGGDRDAYTEIAQFLAEVDLDAGLEAFGSKLAAAGAVAGPLARGYTELALAADECKDLTRLMDAILATDDDDLAEEIALLLSAQGKHEQAIALMEHAVRLDSRGPWDRCYRALRVFRAAGEQARVIQLYEELAAERPDQWLAALDVTWLWAAVGDRDKWRLWLERTEAIEPDHAEVGTGWALWYQGGGNLREAKARYEPWRGTWAAFLVDAHLPRIEALGEALGPVDTLCAWVREKLSDEFAGKAAEAALVAGDAGRPWTAVSAALDTIADQQPEGVAEWAERLAQEYPENVAALWAAAEIRGEADRARELLEGVVAEDPANEAAQLALWSATRAGDPEAATKAAVAAVSWADADSDRGTYTDVADFLADADPDAGLKAFASRLDAAGGITGPLGPGCMRLAAATGDVDRLLDALDAILASDDDVVSDEVAVVLSNAGRHAEAMSLMEHAVRIDPYARAYRPSRAHRLFAAAGEEARVLDLYAAVAQEHPGDALVAYATATVMMQAGDREKAKLWIDRAIELDKDNLWLLFRRAWWHEWNGDLQAARRDYESARSTDAPWEEEALERMDALGDATGPVYAVCWVYPARDKELDWDPGRSTPRTPARNAAVEAGQAGCPWLGVVAALRVLAEEEPDRVPEWARRAAEDYPNNLAGEVALAVIATGIETEGLDSPASAARAALAAIDDVAPELVPCVYVVCGEILLREGAREEAAAALRKALETPGITLDWRARAETGLHAASGAAAETEETDKSDEAPASEPGGGTHAED